MTSIAEIVYLTAVSSAFYVSVTCISRLRYKDISFVWCFLYVGFLGHSFWSTSNIVDGVADSRDVTITLLIGLYMAVTEKSWADSVPQVARRKVKNA